MPCCSSDSCVAPGPASSRVRRILWIVLILNATMFGVEIVAGLAAGSASLQADALDFFADAANYGISLFVLGLGLRARARAALLKGISMGLFGLWVIGTVIWHSLHGTVPGWSTMGLVGLAALVVNGACLLLLLAFREGDANMRSVWIWLAQRCRCQFRGSCRCARGVRIRHRLARRDRGVRDGGPRHTGGIGRDTGIARRTAAVRGGAECSCLALMRPFARPLEQRLGIVARPPN